MRSQAALTVVAVFCCWGQLLRAETDKSPPQDTRFEVGAPLITNYTRHDYHGHSQNWVVVQDRRGVMYFSNYDGVLEFDGSSWRLITLGQGTQTNSLALGPDGVIYVGGNGEFGYLASDASGKMKFASLVEKIPVAYRDFGIVIELVPTPHGVYFITNHLIFRWFNNELTRVPAEGFKRISAVTANGQLYVRDSFLKNNHRLYRLTGHKMEQIPLPTALLDQRFANFLPHTQGKVLVVTKLGKLYVFDPELAQKHPEKRDTAQVCFEWPTEVETYLKRNQCSDGIRLDDGRYVLSTTHGGVVIIDKNGKLERVINKNRGLVNDRARRTFIDRDKNLWIALNKGIAHVELSSPLSMYDKGSGLESVTMDTIRHQGRIYATGFSGTHVLSDYALDPKNDRRNFVPVNNIPPAGIGDLATIHGRLYALGGRDRVYQIDGMSAKVMRHVPTATKISSCHSKKFPNHLFVGFWASGFGALEFDPATGNIKSVHCHLNDKKFARFKNNVKHIFADEQGDLWFSSGAEIYQVHFTGDSIDDYDLIQHPSAPLDKNI